MAQSTTLLWSAPMACGTVDQGSTRPRVVVNGNGEPVVLWGRMNAPANFVAIGNGVDFSAPQQITYANVPPAVSYWMGADIAALGNELWFCYKATPENSMPAYARRSMDGGLTWGDTVRISTDAWTRFPSITVPTPGAPVVQYMQFDDGFSNARQVTTRMVNGAFEAPVSVSTPYAPGHVCDCCPNQVVSSGNTVVPLYRNAGPNIRVMYGAVSHNGGASYDTGGLLDPTAWNLNACPSSGPDGFIAGDSLWYVWMSGAMNGTKVYIARADLSDLSHTIEERLHSGQPASTQQNYPRIAGSGDTLGVVWEQSVGMDRNILFSWSTSGIAGLSAPDTVNTEFTGEQRVPDIAFANGAFHIVWSDEVAGVTRYRRAELALATGIQDRELQARVRAWPLPATNVLHVGVAPTAEGWLQLFDMTGRSVWKGHTAATIDVSNRAPGHYVLKASDAAGRPIGTVQVPIVR